jgi:2-polyprenyl-6-hydroxyphenyl methylase/3-demethylubiquinone-9 3-methyltransferase
MESTMLPRLRSTALSSLRWIDKRAPGWLRRGVRRPSWSRRLAEQFRTRERWSEEYESGDWARLRTLEEFGRYSILAGYVRRLGPALRVLDVGCGNGAMMEELHPLGHEYVGCDHAPPALRQALGSSGAKDALLVADAGKLPFLPGSFDVVICNEVLNYLPDVPAAVAAMVRVLTPEGHLLVSLFDAFGREQSDCWEHLQAVCEVVDMVALTKLGSHVTWRIAMLRPHRSAGLRLEDVDDGDSIPLVVSGRDHRGADR